jgi:MOSC domain-containing protein YiiM
MRIVSVNVGRPRLVIWKGTQVSTGIFKDAVEGPVDVKRLNLAGDRQADLSVHGGPDKAVYGYPAEHYPYWRRELPLAELPWGVFGENLTTEGLSEDTLHIGDRLRVGSALLVVTQPRVPCYKLTIRFDRDDMIKRLIASHFSGYYFAVGEEGQLAAGSPIEIVERDPNAVKVSDINRLYYGQSHDHELLERVLNVEALPEGWREHLRQKALR